jgi:eukaryotic-like serine/threonine-protein kinase
MTGAESSYFLARYHILNEDMLQQFRAAMPSGYELECPLSQGGQGMVFRGSLRGETVAIKIFLAPDDPRRLERELVLLREIDCGNLVALRDSTLITVQGRSLTVVAYEYHAGGDLCGHLEPGAPLLPQSTLWRLGREVAIAIEALWAKRIVHRDVKPANIVTAVDGGFVLVDVGFARHLDRSDITAIGGSPGTNGYKSPEQARGRRNLTIHSDVFSLGVSIYELATKAHPFQRDQNRIGSVAAKPLSVYRNDASPAFVRVIAEMMAIIPADRPTNVRARIEELGGL